MHLRVARATNDLKKLAATCSCWERQGRTFEDPEGYRVVLQNAAWP